MSRMLPLLTTTLLVFSCVLSAGQGPDAELDRNRIADGESVTLTLTVPGDLDGEPDFTPLTQDFDILGQAQSSHTSIINGRMDSKRVWRLTLAPKRTGRLALPPIPVGGLQSRPQTLEVTEAGSPAAGGEAPQAFIEVQSDPQTPYVQGQVIYTVRIFHRVKLREGSLSDPAADGMPVERLGEDRSYQEFRHGHRYSVIERRYALFPQHSGELTIEPPLLSAGVLVQSRRSGGSLAQRMFGQDPFGDMNGFFQETRPLRVRGKPLTLQVRPQPANVAGAWLPARSLSLEESWSPEDGFRVGEPVTRTISLRARGLTDSQLPDLQAPTVDGLKVYVDRPQGQTGPADGGLEAMKEFKAALVPTREGRIELPETRIEWWDTVADQPRVAVLPARSIQVLPALMSEPPPGPEPAETAGQHPVAASPAAQADTPSPLPSAGTGDGPGHWPWIAAGLAAAWLLTLLLWLRERRRRVGEVPAGGPKAHAPKADVSAVRQACRGQSPAKARQALLEWARAAWPQHPPAGLSELALRLANEDAATALRELDAVLYAADGGSWDGDGAWRRLDEALKQSATSDAVTDDGPLPPLYPQTG